MCGIEYIFLIHFHIVTALHSERVILVILLLLIKNGSAKNLLLFLLLDAVLEHVDEDFARVNFCSVLKVLPLAWSIS